jgi:5'(3')-deoxyribonucleotidase
LSLGRKVRVGVDFDSTVARIDVPWLARLNALRGTSYRSEDWTDWNLSFLREADRGVFLSLLTPDLYDVVEPYPGAADAIRRLSSEALIEFACVTTNPDKNSAAFTAAKTQWLRKHIPQLADAVLIARNKSGLGLDVLIDDAPHHLQSEDYVPVLVSRPWNESVDAPFRFGTWHEGEALVRRLVEEISAGTYEHSRQLS